ncbi:MAG TPA: MerR family transcriptional regulator [Ferruginibacter sp.]|nr:MerR family transcriptional regulator [Ferruginibacter sp.]
MPLNQISFAFDEAPVKEEPVVKKIVAVEEPSIPKIRVKADNKKLTRGRVSLKEMDAGADLIEIPDDDVLFQKSYYSIGTVAEMFKVNQSLIRLWENEFAILKPRKNGKGDRLFRPEDIKNLKLIFHLLRERKYTMEGAKEFLKQNKRAEEKFQLIESLKKLKGFLNELKADL